MTEQRVSKQTWDSLERTLRQSLVDSVTDVLDCSQYDLDFIRERDLIESHMSRILLTISAIHFKLLVVLHYQDEQLKNLIAQNNEANVKENNELESRFLECGNRFCGDVKRYVHEGVNHLGMSTPCQLSKKTILSDISDDDNLCDVHVGVSNVGQLILAGSLYLYSKTDVEFDIPASAFELQNNTGELEFF